MVPESVLKSVMTAALHSGTLISFRRVLHFAHLGRLAGTNPIPREPMARKRKSDPKSDQKTGASLLSCLNLNAAGVDIGATEIYIAVPGDRDPQPVRYHGSDRHRDPGGDPGGRA